MRRKSNDPDREKSHRAERLIELVALVRKRITEQGDTTTLSYLNAIDAELAEWLAEPIQTVQPAPVEPVVVKAPTEPQPDRLLRVKDILAPNGPIAVSKSTWYNGVKSGRFPQPIKLGPSVTVWRSADIDELMKNGV